jgi:hypothetical protein
VEPDARGVTAEPRRSTAPDITKRVNVCFPGTSSGMRFDRTVMPALVAGIHVLTLNKNVGVDGRNKSRWDEMLVQPEPIPV